MFETTWYGFVLMSTHLVKCASAAFMAIFEANKRFSVKETLGCIGFRLDPFATGSRMLDAWNKLGEMHALPMIYPDPEQCIQWTAKLK
jgi:hypothetical protein